MLNEEIHPELLKEIKRTRKDVEKKKEQVGEKLTVEGLKAELKQVEQKLTRTYSTIRSKMKIFIWEEVLTDYTDGMAIAYAETLAQALEQFPGYVADSLGSPTDVIDCEKSKIPFAAYVYGGS